MSWIKVTLECGVFTKKEDTEQLGNAYFRAAEKKRQSVCDDRSELLERKADVHCSRENPGRFDDQYGLAETLITASF